MNDETTTFEKSRPRQSTLFGVSTRSWIGLELVTIVGYLAIIGTLDPKDLVSITTFVLGHLFATHTQGK